MKDADRKRRAAHKHAKHFKQLTHRRIKRSKGLLKRSKELGELNQDLNNESGSLIKALTSKNTNTGKIMPGDFTVTIFLQRLEEKTGCREKRWFLTLGELGGTAHM